MNLPRLVLFACPALLAVITLAAPSPRSLAGPWHLQLDPANAGVAERWFARDLPGSIELPGSLPGQGIGDPVTVTTPWIGSIFDPSYFTAPVFAPYRQPGNIKVPFWLQPATCFAGAAWYERELEVPAAWAGRRLVLTLERPHWKTTVWLDEREIGSDVSLSTPHEYDLGTAVAPGRHRLTLRVDNSLVVDIGINSHSITDHTQGNWNGIVGRIELTSTAPAWIDDVQVHPRAAVRTIVVQGRVGGREHLPADAAVELRAGPVDGRTGPVLRVPLQADGTFAVTYPLGAHAPLWDEFQPALHRLTVALPNGELQSVTFGLREVAAAGTQITLNGRPLFLRGTLECAIHPLTGHPPTEREPWRKLIRAAQAHGLNHLRFHSWCPPEAAFAAADELGCYLQIEAASWPNQSTTLGDGKPVDAWLDAETARIQRAYGNHPSFLLMAAGNEPGGDHHVPWLKGWVARQKAADSRRLYTAGSGWPEIPENDYSVLPDPRIQHWTEGLASRINRLPPETRSDYRAFIEARPTPVVSHEIGQWCVYPNFSEMAKYTGYLKPRNFEIFRTSLAEHQLADRAQAFLLASGKLQALCYKEEIESALRTPGMAGFQLLGLQDFPGQGTALVGVVDPFWESKGYITPGEFHRFCSQTVPLARLAKRVFTTGETLAAELDVAHFGATNLPGVTASWTLRADDGRVVAKGRFSARTIATGGLTTLGPVTLDLRDLPAPAHYRLIAALDGLAAENDWDVWVYPAAVAVEAPASVVVARELDPAALAALDAGGTVFLTLPPARLAGDARGPVQLGFSSIFWNTAWTNGQAPHTLGILCDPAHPALADFPTEAHSNWQWWYPIHHAGAMILDGLPAELRPLVAVIDDWVTNRRLALVFEARVGRGKVLVSSIDFAAADDPVNRQLYASLLHYVASPRFAPTVALTADQLRQLTADPPK